MAVMLVLIALIFAAGAAAAAVLIVSWGIRKEERELSMTRRAPGPVTQGTRALTGLYVRQRSDAADLLTDRQDALV
jgi:hypothetical protein